MSVHTWMKSNADYSRKLAHSAVEGACFGEEAFLHGQSLESFVVTSSRRALRPAAIGALLGVVAGFSISRRRTVTTLGFGFLGGAIGFGAGLAWHSRHLLASAAEAAWKKVDKARDEHWFEKNPIDYA